MALRATVLLTALLAGTAAAEAAPAACTLVSAAEAEDILGKAVTVTSEGAADKCFWRAEDGTPVVAALVFAGDALGGISAPDYYRGLTAVMLAEGTASIMPAVGEAATYITSAKEAGRAKLLFHAKGVVVALSGGGASRDHLAAFARTIVAGL